MTDTLVQMSDEDTISVSADEIAFLLQTRDPDLFADLIREIRESKLRVRELTKNNGTIAEF